LIPLVSVSGGKDSTATLLLAIERHGAANVRAAFADTGNEHESTYDYVRYLAGATGVAIEWLRADFADWWWRKRTFIQEKWPERMARATVEPDDDADLGELDAVRTWTDEQIAEIQARVLAVFDKGPTGNPYLDLCIIKGRFPSRRAQFCTQYLKTEPLVEHQLGLIEKFGAVESWQGVRADESESRAKLPERDDRGGGLTVYRPILRWNVDQVFAQHRKHGIEPNPLYRLGMSRVGCFPCINAAKDEVLQISKRAPEHIDRIEEWERIVSACSRRSLASFFPSPTKDNRAELRGTNIRAYVEWSKTQRGGRMVDWIKVHEEPAACASAYGLCE
jgi:3'-phosphoadenosine 5'-phosphosulfate sulfotransferase (PAPS reductase)/FAD synthetase